MSSRIVLVLSVLAIVALPGCSFITSFDGFTSGEEGDGGRDGGPPGDAPMEDAPRDARMVDVFEPDAPGSARLEVVKDGDGTGTVTSDVFGIVCGDACVAFVPMGEIVVLTALADASSELAGWAGDDDACSDTEATCSVTLDVARTITATFTLRQYPVDVVIGGDGVGTVASADAMITCDGTDPEMCTATYTHGTSVTLTASSTSPSVFAGWGGGGCSGTGPCTFVVTETTTISASFDRDRRSVSVSLAGTGTGAVTSSPSGIDCGVDCSESYDVGTMVTLTAAPASNSTFAGWSGGSCSGTATTCMVTTDVAHTVVATFTLRNYTLTVARGGTGAGSVFSDPPHSGAIVCGSTCSTMQSHGTTIFLDATPSIGSTFAGWSGGGCDPLTPTCGVTLTADETVTASFTLNQYLFSVTTSGAGDGTVTSAPAGISCSSGSLTGCATNFAHGTMVTLTASPAIGSDFFGWTGACAAAGSSPTCMVTVDAAASANAEFRRQRFDLNVDFTGAGSGMVVGGPLTCTSDCTAPSIPHGMAITLTATAMAGSTFGGWGGDCAAAGTSPTCMITITAETNVGATFLVGSNSLSVTRIGNGTVTSAPPGISCGDTCAATFMIGTAITLTAVADAGNMFTGWSGAGCAGTGTCMVTMVPGGLGVTATFAPIPRRLTITRSGTGTGGVVSSPSGIDCSPTTTPCAFDFDHGTLVTISAAADASSTFAGWLGAGCSGTAPCTVTMDMARNVTATFTLRSYLLDVTREGGGSGTVATSAPSTGINCGADCTETYVHGTNVTLSASPAIGSMFTGWAGPCSGTGSCVVPMTSAQSVRATFQLQQFQLVVTKIGTGTVQSGDTPRTIDCGTTCAAAYDYLTSVTLTATPAASFRFAGWSGAGCSGTGPCIVQMTAMRNVTATFIRQVTLTVTVDDVGGAGPLVTSGDGQIICYSGGGAGCAHTYDQGTSVIVSAMPPTWAGFDGWSGAPGCGGSPSCAVTLTADTNVTARMTMFGDLAFATNDTFPGTSLGGLSGADDICQTAAERAGLPGEYMAWLSDSRTHASERVIGSGGSTHGWVRVDGIAFTGETSTGPSSDDLITGNVRNPLWVTETGSIIPTGDVIQAWTGTSPDGRDGGETCNDWTMAVTMGDGGTGPTGIVGGLARGSGAWTANQQSVSCAQPRRLYCFNVDHRFPPRSPAPPPSDAGYVFVSSATVMGNAGRGTMDSACQTEAAAARLPSPADYLAFVGSPGSAAGSRVTFAGPFYRPDGWLIGDRNQVVRATSRLSSFITQHADATPYANEPGWMPEEVWTGMLSGGSEANPTNADTCIGWTSIGFTSNAHVGDPSGTLHTQWGHVGTRRPCGASRHFYCIRAVP